MRKIKQIVSILLVIIVIIFTGIIVRAAFSGGELGDTVKIAYISGTWNDTWYHYESDKNIYCIQKGANTMEGKYKINTIVKIKNDQIVSADSESYATTSFLDKIEKHQNSKTAMDANARLAYLIQLADNASNRKRSTGGGMHMQRDRYQWAMWAYLDTWVNEAVYNNDTTIKSALAGCFHGSTN